MNELRFYVKGLRKTLRAYEKSFKCERPNDYVYQMNIYMQWVNQINQKNIPYIHTYTNMEEPNDTTS